VKGGRGKGSHHIGICQDFSMFTRFGSGGVGGLIFSLVFEGLGGPDVYYLFPYMDGFVLF